MRMPVWLLADTGRGDGCRRRPARVLGPLAGAAVRVPVLVRMELVVRYDYGYVSPWIRSIDGVWRLIAGPDAIAFTVGQSAGERVELTREDANVYATFTVKAGQRIPFTLVWHPSNVSVPFSMIRAWSA